MPLKPLFQTLSPLFHERQANPALPDDSAPVRQTNRAAAWRAQISRAFAYQYGRARTEDARTELEEAYQKAMEDRPDFARIHHGSDFREAPRKPFDPREAREIMAQARSIERGTYATREKGQHGGVIGKSALRVLEVLLFVIWPKGRKGVFPSLAHIAGAAQLSVRTVQTSLAVLKLLGFLSVFRRMRRVPTALGLICQQDTNAYLFHLPKGLGAIGAALFSRLWPDGKNFQAKESIYYSYGFSPANPPEESGVRPPKGPHELSCPFAIQPITEPVG